MNAEQKCMDQYTLLHVVHVYFFFNLNFLKIQFRASALFLTDHRGYAAAKQMSVTTCVVPVYAAGVLSAFNSVRIIFLN